MVADMLCVAAQGQQKARAPEVPSSSSKVSQSTSTSFSLARWEGDKGGDAWSPVNLNSNHVPASGQEGQNAASNSPSKGNGA